MVMPALGPASLYYTLPAAPPAQGNAYPSIPPFPWASIPPGKPSSNLAAPRRSNEKYSFTPSKPQPTDQATQVKQVLKAAAFLLGAGLINYGPLRPAKLASQIISSDWKDWAKVLLGLGGIDAAEKAFNWEPPVWLKAGLNVVLVTPFAVKLKPTLKNVLKNLGQSVVLAPFVSGLAAFNHIVSEKAERPLQDNLNVPPLATRIGFSILTTLLGLLTLSAVGRALSSPKKASQSPSSTTSKTQAEQSKPKVENETTRSGLVGGACACCPSMICINDLGQMGSAIIDSYQQKQTNQGVRA